MLCCSGTLRPDLAIEEYRYMNHILSDPAPAEVRVVDVVNGSDSSTVTIEWTPSTALVQYTTTTILSLYLLPCQSPPHHPPLTPYKWTS